MRLLMQQVPSTARLFVSSCTSVGCEQREPARGCLCPTDSWFSQLWSVRTEGTHPHHSAHGGVITHPWSSLLAKRKVLWHWLLSLFLRKYHYFKQWLFHYCGERDCGHLKDHDRVCSIIRWSWKKRYWNSITVSNPHALPEGNQSPCQRKPIVPHPPGSPSPTIYKGLFCQDQKIYFLGLAKTMSGLAKRFVFL